MHEMLLPLTQTPSAFETLSFDARESNDALVQRLKADRLFNESLSFTPCEPSEPMPIEAPEPTLRSESRDTVYDHRPDDAPSRTEYWRESVFMACHP